MKVKADKGWTPRLLQAGRVYCSPRCGHMCSRKDYDDAVAGAAKLVALLGKGWEAHVWENFGWHYSARKGVCEILARPSVATGKTTYSFWFNGLHQIVITEGPVKNPVAMLTEGLARVDELIATLMQQAGDVRGFRKPKK